MKHRWSETGPVDRTVSTTHIRSQREAQIGVDASPTNKIGNQVEHQNVQGSVNNTFHYYNDLKPQPLRIGSQDLSGANEPDVSAHRDRCMKSLDFPQHNTRYMSIKTALQQTCEWLTQRTQYRDWSNNENILIHKGFLWIKGKPGTGKSTMMKFLTAKEKKHANRKIIVTFFFHARGTILEKSTLGLYRSLLLQMMDSMPNLKDLLDPVDIDRNEINGSDWSIEFLKDLISQSILRLSDEELVLLVDALDECSDYEVLDMVRFFESLGELAIDSGIRFKVCLSSRHYPNITIKHGYCIVLEHQSEHQEDIKRFINSELRVDNSQKAEKIKDKILNKASGIFLWVALVVPILNRAYSRGRTKELEKILERIPEKLENLFEEILSRDLTQEEDVQQQQRQQQQQEFEICVEWILHAQRPLSIRELYFAINFVLHDEFSVQGDVDEVDEDDMARFILDCSKGFVEGTKGISGTVQFIHESVREFFLQRMTSQDKRYREEEMLALVHDRIKSQCQHYIIKTFDQCMGFAFDLHEIFPLVEYAVEYCLDHSNISQGFGLSQAVFLAEFALEPWILFRNMMDESGVHRYHYPLTVDLLSILATECLPHLLTQWITVCKTIDVSGDHWAYPLIATIMSNQTSDRLKSLESFLVPVDSAFTGVQDLEAYLRPNEADQSQAMRFLEDIELWDNCVRGETPFYLSIKRDHISLAKCLLATGKIDVDAVSMGESVMIMSLRSNYIHIAEYLIRHGAKYAEYDTDWLLTVFSLEGRVEPVLQILANGVTPEQKSKLQALALALASIGGHLNIVSHFVIAGVNIDHENPTFPSPLLAALMFGRKEIVQTLIDAGTEIDVHSALIAAMTEWHDEYARNMPADARLWICDKIKQLGINKTRSTAETLVRILLDARPDLELIQPDRIPSNTTHSWFTIEFLRSPLLVATQYGYLDIIEPLLRNRHDFELATLCDT